MHEALKRAVKAANGGTALAGIIGVSPSAVSQWRRAPAERVLQIEAASGVPKEELRPDLYQPPTEEPSNGHDTA